MCIRLLVSVFHCTFIRGFSNVGWRFQRRTALRRHPALWVLAPELDPAELWAGWPWGGADRTAAGARADGRVREEAAARAASRRRPPAARLDAPDLPPERALHERAHAGGEPQLAPAGAGREVSSRRGREHCACVLAESAAAASMRERRAA